MLTKDLLFQKFPSKNPSLSDIKNINMWGKGLTDISIISHLPNIEVVSLSVNNISSLEPFSKCYKLKELYLRKNQISSFTEIKHLTKLKALKILWLQENPICEFPSYRSKIIEMLPQLAKLDNIAICPFSNNDSQNKTISHLTECDNKENKPLKRAISSIDAVGLIPEINKLNTGIKMEIVNQSVEDGRNNGCKGMIRMNTNYKDNKGDNKGMGHKKIKLKLKINNDNGKERRNGSKEAYLPNIAKQDDGKSKKLFVSKSGYNLNKNGVSNKHRNHPILTPSLSKSHLKNYIDVNKSTENSNNVSIAYNADNKSHCIHYSNLLSPAKYCQNKNNNNGNNSGNDHIVRAAMILIDKMSLKDLLALHNEISMKIRQLKK